MKRKGWFKVDGQDGDRSLSEQMTGLRPLVHMVAGKEVLDVGCAEGLISISLASVGARRVHGIEVIPDHVAVARSLAGEWPCTFEVADADTYQPREPYDVVIMLAVLHKLKDPVGACRRFANAALESVVIRLPALGAPPKNIAGRGPCDIPLISRTMNDRGFRIFEITTGPFDEWTSYWRRA